MPPLQNKTADRFEDVKNQLKKLCYEDPTLLLRKVSSGVGISYNATRDIVKNVLNLKPYKYNDYHKLQPQCYQGRVDFAISFCSCLKTAMNGSYFQMRHIFIS